MRVVFLGSEVLMLKSFIISKPEIYIPINPITVVIIKIVNYIIFSNVLIFSYITDL